ncbi:MAG: SDR family NAD(P)-dependent oxidoreductase [Saprospiraceae bacterium]|nr:SDR family NAD(P)-dependent oxidoreductase [Saprospiraceae bacterium]
MDFNNKTVWITGASSGIGEGLAKAFNAKGAKVILSARNVDELKRVQASFTNPSTPSVILPLDLQKYREIGDVTAQAIAAFGKVDILVNNAGISQRSLAVETDFKDDLRILEIDLIGTIALTKSILPHLIEQKDAQIVVISSVMGKINTKYRTSYAAAKHGIVGYFDCLRLELDGLVNICNIMPGFINTNIVKNAVSLTFNSNNQNAAGMSPEVFAEKALKAIAQRKKNVFIGGIKEQFGMVMKRISPYLFDKMIIKMEVV